jgi:hypothetical protein
MTIHRLPPCWLRGLLLAALAGFAALNLLAWHQAGCFLRYVEAGDRTAPPEHLQGLRKLGVLLTGVRMTRPRNTVAPAATTPPARVQRLASGDGEIEVWWLDHPQPRGTVLVLPGYAEAKTDLLDDAYAWRDLGFSAAWWIFAGPARPAARSSHSVSARPRTCRSRRRPGSPRVGPAAACCSTATPWAAPPPCARWRTWACRPTA